MNGKMKKIVIALLMICVVGLTACGQEQSAKSLEKYVYVEKEITNPNPLTGKKAKNLPSRPLLVSTDNVGDAIPQYGISQADIVYELPVEGKQSRLEAIYYGDIPETVGPCRSVRPYIVDLAREYDAILVHDGWSPAAKEYLAQGVVADIPAQTHGYYYRTSAKSAPHNCLVDTDKIWESAKNEGFDKKQEVRSFSFMNVQERAVFTGTQEKYLADVEKKVKETIEEGQEYELPDLSGITVQQSVEVGDIHVSYDNCKSVYSYDPETGLYTRSVNGGAYQDLNNGKNIKMSNVIVYKVSSQVLDAKGRLEINMCSGGKAYVFTGGRLIEGTWSKADQDAPTLFKDAEGNEIKLSTGKTWINIIDGDASFKYDKIESEDSEAKADKDKKDKDKE